MYQKKSPKDDIELPLLPRKSSKTPSVDYANIPSRPDLESKPQQPEIPKYLDTSILSRAFFFWVTNIIRRGNEETFQQTMHYDLREYEECGSISNRFISTWRQHLQVKYSFIYAQFLSFKSQILQTQLLAFLNTLFNFTGPVLVSQIIGYTESEDATTYDGIRLIFFFILSRCIIISLNAQSAQLNSLLQAKIVKGTRSLVFSKVLAFPLKRSQEYSSGAVLNFMLVDSENASRIFVILPQLVQLPVMIILGIYTVYISVGLAFIGVAITIIIVAFLMSLLTKATNKYQKEIMAKKDIRTKRTTEILTGIKYVKMSGLESKFLNIIGKDRENELIVWAKRYTIATLRMFLTWLTPTMLNLSVFGSYILLGEELTSRKAFVVVSTLMIIQGPIFGLGHLINEVLNAKVALDRIQNFLAADDIDTSYIKHSQITHPDIALKLTNGTFSWLDDEAKPKDDSPKKAPVDLENGSAGIKKKTEPILKDLNIEIKTGSFVAILGDVGSGKSSLFHALFGEMKPDAIAKPKIEINGNVAYLSQKPWVINDTVKNNILFERPYDADAYKEAIRGSCLEQDLKSLIKRDETEIGEKGVNLSGGQKARIALARAIYANKDIYLLDDPLSAVDAHVGKFILEECLAGQLKEKTRVLVTHKIESLKYVDYIYIFKGGKVVAEGDLNTISNNSYYQEIEEKSSKKQDKPEDNSSPTDSPTRKAGRGGARGGGSRGGRGGSRMGDSSSRAQAAVESLPKKSSVYEKEDQKQLYDKLMLNEDRNVGALGIKAWKDFFTYFGDRGYFGTLLFVIILWITLKTGGDFWLAHWSENGSTDQEHSNAYYYGIYAFLGVSSGFLVYVRLKMVFFRSLDVNRRLHNEMFAKVIRAPVNLFFDRVPLGRLVNRFTADLQIFDFSVPFQLGTLLYLPFNLFSRFLVCFFVGTAWVFPLAAFFFYIGFRIQQTYLNVYREVFRLSRITSSPVTSLFTESLDGLTHIRSANYQDQFMKKYFNRQNENMKNQILLSALQGWFSFRINMASFVIIGPTIAAAILFSKGSNNGLIGLLITYLLDLNNNLIQVLQTFSNFESNLISFERCKAFTEVDTEKSHNTMVPLANYDHYSWPNHGEIEVKNYFTKYRPTLPYVLKDISFKIHPSEKIGVVGRTGSGKSTLFLSLLRIIEPQSGKVYIDGVDIAEMGLDDLRTKITIIPQDPLLYKGTVRSNLDLLEEYSDLQVWKALEKVCLKQKFQEVGLNSEIKEGGENLSAGEKQLMCIGRAILKKNKIILIDEATSSIDSVTEEAILASIRENFKDCTVITIAHRLKTIIESDRVLYLANGEVLEYDTPNALLENEHSNFYKLWHEYEAAKS